MIIRTAVAVLAATLVATQVVRNAAVRGQADAGPALAARLWSSHPAAELPDAMTQIAEAAREGRLVPPSALSIMADVAVKEPLAPEPFLVRGMQAQSSGDGTTAQRAFEAAQLRDPRSVPAAYFLADRYFLVGDAEHGLREIATLARLSPYSPVTVGPYLAEYARNPSNWPAFRSLLRTKPELADPVLTALASNIATAPAVLAVADPREKAPQARWLGPLLNTLTGAGEYAKAYAIWARMTGVGGTRKQPIHDAAFSDEASPPPFNWALTSSAVGLAERRPGGRLHVLFYGQVDGILATQLLLLEPGAYRLSMQLHGGGARALNWSIWCAGIGEPIASASLAAAAKGWSFTVPAGCQAQWLKLSGSSIETHGKADVTIAALRLEEAGPNV